jgi:hypothetical protein
LNDPRQLVPSDEGLDDTSAFSFKGFARLRRQSGAINRVGGAADFDQDMGAFTITVELPQPT